MIPARFDYAAPESLPEAIAILQKQPAGKVLAGGHDLLTEMKLRRASPPSAGGPAQDLQPAGHPGSELRPAHRLHVHCTELAGNAVIVKTYQALAEAADSIGDARCATPAPLEATWPPQTRLATWRRPCWSWMASSR